VKRCLFTVGSTVSLVLWIVVAALWWDAQRGTRGMDFRTRRGHYWQFCSTRDGLGVLRVSGWPEPAGVTHVGYSFTQGPRARTLPVFIWGGMGGAHARTAGIPAVVQLGRGAVCVVVGSDGTVLRIPPAPSGPITAGMLSLPLPFWSVFVPHGAVVAMLSVPPLLAAFRTGRARRRRRAGGCPVCGYDVRATPDRCPECGTSLQTEQR
jgi:hypothetical protein